MAGIKSLLGLALSGSAGMTLLILACTLHQLNWLPATVIIFYLLVPFPILISRQVSSTGFTESNNPPKEWAYMLTTGIVESALALPIVLSCVGSISVAASILSIASSILIFSTILAFFIIFQTDDPYASGIF